MLYTCIAVNVCVCVCVCVCGEFARGTSTSSMDVGATKQVLCHGQQIGRDAPTFDEIRGKIVMAHKV